MATLYGCWLRTFSQQSVTTLVPQMSKDTNPKDLMLETQLVEITCK